MRIANILAELNLAVRNRIAKPPNFTSPPKFSALRITLNNTDSLGKKKKLHQNGHTFLVCSLNDLGWTTFEERNWQLSIMQSSFGIATW